MGALWARRVRAAPRTISFCWNLSDKTCDYQTLQKSKHEECIEPLILLQLILTSALYLSVDNRSTRFKPVSGSPSSQVQPKKHTNWFEKY